MTGDDEKPRTVLGAGDGRLETIPISATMEAVSDLKIRSEFEFNRRKIKSDRRRTGFV